MSGRVDVPTSEATLRDFIAAKAMQGWLASFSDTAEHPVYAGHADAIAHCSYAMADAMLAARGAP